MTRFLKVILWMPLMACPGMGDGGGGGTGGTGGGTGGSTPPVALVFTSAMGAPVYLKSIASGSNFFDCGIASDDQVQCWGIDNVGRLGHPSAGNAPAPPRAVNLGTRQTVRSLAVGAGHNCAILTSGPVKCWGSNRDGQLGIGDTTDRGSLPDQLGDNLSALDFGPGLTATSVAAGGYHSCAILSDDSLRCWGGASAGQLGTNERTNDPVVSAAKAQPVFPAGLVATQVACGAQHTCAIDKLGEVYCWGMNSDGQLGLGDDHNRYSPQRVELGQDARGVQHVARQIVAGSGHTCAILNDASVKCWGDNRDGELGIDSVEERATGPRSVKLEGRVQALALNHGHSCALLEDHRMMCWGMARLSRFDRVVGKRAPYPITNLNGKRPSLIATGPMEACLVTEDRVTYCLDDMQLYDFRF